jgi:hypothetical protein
VSAGGADARPAEPGALMAAPQAVPWARRLQVRSGR